MDIEITFRGMEHTEALDSKIRSKSQKLDRMVKGESRLHWICFVEGNSQIAEAKLVTKGNEFFAKAESDDLYKGFDEVVQKLQQQLEKAKPNYLHSASHERQYEE